MRIAGVVEQLPGSRPRASSEQLGIVSDGVTRSDALSELRTLVDQRIADGSEIVEFDVFVRDDAWQRMAKTFADDPLDDKWREAIEKYRDRTSHGGCGA